MRARKFTAKVTAAGRRVYVSLPFDPNAVWGARQRHYVSGTIDGHPIRGSLSSDDSGHFLALGAAWRRDSGIEAGQSVSVSLQPEGPQRDTLAGDVMAALAAEPAALAFFESLATYYRNTYVKWIESAKRSETRASRIAQMVRLLAEGKKQK